MNYHLHIIELHADLTTGLLSENHVLRLNKIRRSPWGAEITSACLSLKGSDDGIQGIEVQMQ